MEITGLPCQSSFGRKARTEIRLLFLKTEREVRKLKQLLFFKTCGYEGRERVGDIQKGKQSVGGGRLGFCFQMRSLKHVYRLRKKSQ